MIKNCRGKYTDKQVCQDEWSLRISGPNCLLRIVIGRVYCGSTITPQSEGDLVAFVALLKGDDLVRSKGPREMPGIKIKADDTNIYELGKYLKEKSDRQRDDHAAVDVVYEGYAKPARDHTTVRQRDDHAAVDDVYEGYAKPARDHTTVRQRDDHAAVDDVYEGYAKPARDHTTVRQRDVTDRHDSSGHDSDRDTYLRQKSDDGQSSDDSWLSGRQTTRLDRNPHCDSDIPYSDLIQGISDSLGLPLTKTAVKPSRKPSACMGSDDETKKEKLLPLSLWLASLC